MLVGVLGDGQLGRMLKEAASILGVDVQTFGAFGNLDACEALIKRADRLTFEFENVPETVLSRLPDCRTFPSPNVLRVTSDRLREKEALRAMGLSVTPFSSVRSIDDVGRFNTFPCIVKTRRWGYDGRGQIRLDSYADLGEQARCVEEILAGAPCIVEKVVPFACEISVIVARDQGGHVVCYDVTRSIHHNHVLHETQTPAGLPDELELRAKRMAAHIVGTLGYVGVMGVEMFCVDDGNSFQLVVNELAPRVHNSGHWTQDACLVSQFEQHIRAVIGLPLGDTQRHSDVRMLNLLGHNVDLAQRMFDKPFHHVHLYGKAEVKKGRKMGHVNVIRPRGGQGPIPPLAPPG